MGKGGSDHRERHTRTTEAIRVHTRSIRILCLGQSNFMVVRYVLSPTFHHLRLRERRSRDNLEIQ